MKMQLCKLDSLQQAGSCGIITEMPEQIFFSNRLTYLQGRLHLNCLTNPSYGKDLVIKCFDWWENGWTRFPYSYEFLIEIKSPFSDFKTGKPVNEHF